MNPIEGIDIKLVELSDKKVRLDYSAPLICDENEIKKLSLKIRYRLDSDGMYHMIYPKDAFLNSISNALRVKKKFIHYGTLFFGYPRNEFEFENKKFNNLIKSVYITDDVWFKEWNRNNKLGNILS